MKTEYGSEGRLSKLTDAQGYEINTTYDLTNAGGQGYLQTVYDQFNKPSTVAIDPRGNLLREADQVGQTIVRTYSPEDYLLSERRVIGQLDDAANGETDDLVTTYEPDARGLNKKVIDPLGNATLYAYNEAGLPTSVTDPLGNSSRYFYKTLGTSAPKPNEFFPPPPLAATVDPLDNATSFEYDTRGLPTKVTAGAKYDAFFHYDLMTGGYYTNNYYFGCPTTDPACQPFNRPEVAKTTFDYTDTGDLEQTTDSKGISRTMGYDANGNSTGTEFVWTNPDDPQDVRTVTTGTIYDADDKGRERNTPSGTTFTDYDDLGQPFRTTNELGLASEQTKDTRGQLIQSRSQSVEDSQTVWLVSRTFYDAAGRPVVTTDQHPEGTTEPIGGTRTLYDDAGRVVGSETLIGVVINITGAPGSEQAVLTTPGTVVATTTTHYDAAGRTDLTIDRFGNETQTAYSKAGSPLQTRSQARDENDNPVWLASRTVYDQYGRASVSVDQYVEGSTTPRMGTRTVYNDDGQVIRTERLSGVVIDLVNGVTTLTSAGTVISSSETIYDDKGRVQQSIGPSGQITDYEYDNLGRRAATIGHPVTLGGVTVRHRIETEYNDYGQVALERTNIKQLEGGTIDDTQARETRFEYDQFGNSVKTIFDDGTFTRVEYDTLQRKTADIDQLGNRTEYEYDDAGRLSAVILPAIPDPQNNNQLTNPRYDYAYDEQGNQTLIRDPLDRETTFTFDDRSRQLTRTLPLGQGASGAFTEQFEYDDLGRQMLHVSFEGVVTQFVYDDGPSRTGRLIEKRFFENLVVYNSGAGTPTERVEYEYDALGREFRVTQVRPSGSAVTETAYDAEGRVASITSPEGTVNYEYDALGRRIRTYTGTAADPVNDFRYEYDELDRLTKVTVWERGDVPLPVNDRETTEYEYDLLGNLDLERKPNGIVTDYVYDALSRLDKLTHYSPDATPSDLSDNPKLAEFDYTVRADGKRTQVNEYRGGNQTGTFRWEYDAVGRLVDEVFDSYEDNSLDYTARYAFDLNGNRLTKDLWKTAGTVSGTPDERISYTYDANDRLLEETLDLLVGSDKETTYAWGSGNAATYQTGKSVTDLAASQLVEQTAYSYNLQGRLSQAAIGKFTGGQLVQRDTSTFTYGDDGLRVTATHKIEADNNGTPATVELTSDTLTRFLNDPQNHTGYSQVLVETTLDNLAAGAVIKTVISTLGHDRGPNNDYRTARKSVRPDIDLPLRRPRQHPPPHRRRRPDRQRLRRPPNLQLRRLRQRPRLQPRHRRYQLPLQRRAIRPAFGDAVPAGKVLRCCDRTVHPTRPIRWRHSYAPQPQQVWVCSQRSGHRNRPVRPEFRLDDGVCCNWHVARNWILCICSPSTFRRNHLRSMECDRYCPGRRFGHRCNPSGSTRLRAGGIAWMVFRIGVARVARTVARHSNARAVAGTRAGFECCLYLRKRIVRQ